MNTHWESGDASAPACEMCDRQVEVELHADCLATPAYWECQ